MKATTHEVAKKLKELISDHQNHFNNVDKLQQYYHKEGSKPKILLSGHNTPHNSAPLQDEYLTIPADKMIKFYQDLLAEKLDALNSDFESLNDLTAPGICGKYCFGVLKSKPQ